MFRLATVPQLAGRFGRPSVAERATNRAAVAERTTRPDDSRHPAAPLR